MTVAETRNMSEKEIVRGLGRYTRTLMSLGAFTEEEARAFVTDVAALGMGYYEKKLRDQLDM